MEGQSVSKVGLQQLTSGDLSLMGKDGNRFYVLSSKQDRLSLSSHSLELRKLASNTAGGITLAEVMSLFILSCSL